MSKNFVSILLTSINLFSIYDYVHPRHIRERKRELMNVGVSYS